MQITHRHALRKSDLRELKDSLRVLLGDQVDSLFKKTVERIKTDSIELYAENRIVLAFKLENHYLPSLRALNEGLVTLPQVTVDMGAVPYVTNGADIMAPGIKDLASDLQTGAIVSIVDERFGKSLAIGELLFDCEVILQMKKGKAIRNLHYVNDAIWSVKL